MLDTINENKYISINIKIKALRPLYLYFDKVENGAVWVEKYCDDMGIPYIAANMLIKIFIGIVCLRYDKYDADKKGKCYKLVEDLLTPIKKDRIAYINSALLSNYKCIRNALMFIDKKEMLSKKQVCDIFTKKTDLEYDGVLHHTRIIKAGCEFITNIYIDKEYAEFVLEILNGDVDVVYPFDFTSKVSVQADICANNETFEWIQFETPNKKALKDSKKSDNYRLYYSVENISELVCRGSIFFAGSSDDYISGFYMHELVNNIYNDLEKTDIPNNIIFSNAYPSIKHKRGTVAPRSFLVDKLDKTKLRDRTYSLPVRSQKGDFEQLKSLDKTIISSVDDENVYSVEEKINGRAVEYTDKPIDNPYAGLKAKKAVVFGLSNNQKFEGYIQGPLHQIEKIAQDIAAFRDVYIGLFCGQGFGRCKLKFHKLESTAATKQQLTNEFVIKASSPVLLYDDDGNETVKSKDFLHSVEKAIGAEGDLEACIINCSAGQVLPGSPEMEHRPRAWQAIDAGSIYYVKTKSGRKIDISQYKKLWIGEYNKWGYGEVDIYLTDKNYFKTLEEIDPTNKEIVFDLTYQEVVKSKSFVQYFIDEYLKSTVLRLAKIDALQYRFNKQQDGFDNDNIPKDLIIWIKQHFDGSIDDEELFEVYEKNLLEEA